MVVERVKKQYRAYYTITREQAFAASFDGKYINRGLDLTLNKTAAYDFKTARLLFELYKGAEVIDFCRPEHNQNTTRYLPPWGYIVYVKSSYSGLTAKVRYRGPQNERSICDWNLNRYVW